MNVCKFIVLTSWAVIAAAQTLPQKPPSGFHSGAEIRERQDAIVASYRPLRDIDGQLYDFSEVIRFRTPPYFINDASVKERRADGAFLTIPVDKRVFNPDEQMSLARIFAATGRMTIDDGMAIAATQRSHEEIFVAGLPRGADKCIISLVALADDYRRIITSSGRPVNIPVWKFGTAVVGSESYSNIIRVTRRGLIQQPVIRKTEEANRRTAEFQEKRAEEGSDEAQYLLGIRYLNGDGVDRDRGEAKKWLKRSADQGYKPAADVLKEIPEIGPGK